MHYPALTFCRDPPYKAKVLAVSSLFGGLFVILTTITTQSELQLPRARKIHEWLEEVPLWRGHHERVLWGGHLQSKWILLPVRTEQEPQQWVNTHLWLSFSAVIWAFLSADVEISSSLHFNYGRCFTIKPLVQTSQAWKDYGYSVLLKHDENGSGPSSNPGWHLFLHEPSEPFSGKESEVG